MSAASRAQSFAWGVVTGDGGSARWALPACRGAVIGLCNTWTVPSGACAMRWGHGGAAPAPPPPRHMSAISRAHRRPVRLVALVSLSLEPVLLFGLGASGRGGTAVASGSGRQLNGDRAETAIQWLGGAVGWGQRGGGAHLDPPNSQDAAVDFTGQGLSATAGAGLTTCRTTIVDAALCGRCRLGETFESRAFRSSRRATWFCASLWALPWCALFFTSITRTPRKSGCSEAAVAQSYCLPHPS